MNHFRGFLFFWNWTFVPFSECQILIWKYSKDCYWEIDFTRVYLNIKFEIRLLPIPELVIQIVWKRERDKRSITSIFWKRSMLLRKRNILFFNFFLHRGAERERERDVFRQKIYFSEIYEERHIRRAAFPNTIILFF